MADELITAISQAGDFRVFVVTATETVGEAQRRHDTWPNASAALGRTLIGARLLAAAGLKNEDDMLTIRLKGDGPAGALVVDATAAGTVRGYIGEPHISLPLNLVGKIDVAGAIGTKGILSVTKAIGVGEPFTGQVPLISGEIGQDLTYYLAKSEQTPSAVGVSVFVNADNTIGHAGGFLVQALPGASDKALAALETNIKTLPLVSEMLKSGMTSTEIARRVMGDMKIDVLDKQPMRFECTCSKEHFGAIIATLKRSDILAMINEDHGAEVVCKFCGNKYNFDEQELQDLLEGEN